MADVTLPLKWRSDAFAVTLPSTSTLADVKAAVAARTGVPAGAVKVVGVKAQSGGMATDATVLSDVVPPRPGASFMVLGTPAADAAALAAAAPTLADEPSDDERGGEDDVDPRTCPDAQAKLARRIEAFTLVLRRPPRPGKRLLVLDIDYTLFDLSGTAEAAHELARPYLHSFLTAAHAHYDIVIWSATSMKWVDVKMRELGW